MAKKNECDYRQTIETQYEELMEHCQAHMDRVEAELPAPKFDFHETLARGGVNRRDFMKWSAFMTTALMLPAAFRPLVARAAENFSRLPVVWLHFAECTGCSEAFLRSSYPNVDDILLDTISLEYHETLMPRRGIRRRKTSTTPLPISTADSYALSKEPSPRGSTDTT